MGIDGLLRRLAPLALEGQMHHKHLAIVWRHKTLLAVARNKPKRHAEVAAIKKVLRKEGNVSGATLLSIRTVAISEGYNLRLAKPCDGCLDACRKAGIRRLWWTTDGGLERLFL